MELARTAGDPAVLRQRLLDLGLCCLRAEDVRPTAAIAAYEEALSLTEVLGPHPQHGDVLLNLGDARRAAGDLDGAHRAYDAALDYARQGADLRMEERALKARAFVAGEEGEPERGGRNYRDLRDFYRRHGRTAESASVTQLIDQHDAVHGEPEVSADELLQALGDRAADSEPALRARLMLRCGMALKAEGRFEEAMGVVGEAAAEAGRAGDRDIEASAFNNLATLYWQSGDASTARFLLASSLDALRELDDPVRLTMTLLTEAELAGALDDAAGEEEALAEASELSRAHARGSALEGVVLLHLARRLDAPQERLDVLHRAAELVRGTGTTGWLVEVLQALAEAQQGTGLREATDETLEEAFQIVKEHRLGAHRQALLVTRARLRERKGDRAGALRDLRDATATADDWRTAFTVEALRQSFFSDHAETFRALARLLAEDGDLEGAFDAANSARSRSLSDVLTPEPARSGLADVQAALDRAGARLLQYVLPAQGPGFVLDVAPEHAEFHHVGTRAEIDETRRRLVVEMAAGGDPSQAAADLRAHVLPSSLDLDGRAVLLVPDSGLERVPFGVLSRLRPPPQPALHVPAEASDAEVLAAYAARLRGGSQAIVWADLEPLITERAHAIVPSGALVGRVPREGIKGAGVVTFAAPLDAPGDAQRAGQPPLPGARREAELIARHLDGKDDVETYVSPELSNYVVTQVAARSADHPLRVVHFACHGRAGAAHQPPAVVLGPEPEDLLTSEAVVKLGLRTDLVVLSACDTGVGQHVEGEGTLSLARAFVAGGARAVVLSLWRVNDRATAALMDGLYTHLSAGRSPEVALQLAQVQLLTDGVWDHPGFWGAFTVLRAG